MKKTNSNAVSKPRLRKEHKGPKKHQFRWAGPMKWQFGKTNYTTVQKFDNKGNVVAETQVNTHDGLLSKYSDYEAWQQACTARGKKSVSKEEFRKFFVLPFEEQKAYFENLNGKRNKVIKE